MCLKTLKRQYKITIFQTLLRANTVQKIKFSIKDFFSKCDQIRRKLRIWSYLLKKIPNGNIHFLYNETLLLTIFLTKIFATNFNEFATKYIVKYLVLILSY